MQDRGISASREMGWASNFRSSILETALRNIRKNQLLGTGWAFTTEEIMWTASLRGVNWGGSGLVTAGDYHNCLVTVAVKCGLPAALTLSCGLFFLIWQAGMRQCGDSKMDFLVLYAGLMGAVLAILGRMLMNGSGQDLQAVCALLGFFHGVEGRFGPEALPQDADDDT
jgi:hypothetical protein